MRGRNLCLHLPDRCSDDVCPCGNTEATAFGGKSSDVAVKENMVMLKKVESGGSITLNDGLWILKWDIERSAREKAVRKRDVWVCVANGGSLTLVSATGAGGHCKRKRERVMHSGRKKTEMCGAVLQAEAASSLRLRL